MNVTAGDFTGDGTADIAATQRVQHRDPPRIDDGPQLLHSAAERRGWMTAGPFAVPLGPEPKELPAWQGQRILNR